MPVPAVEVFVKEGTKKVSKERSKQVDLHEFNLVCYC